jgi:hypothetical protein
MCAPPPGPANGLPPRVRAASSPADRHRCSHRAPLNAWSRNNRPRVLAIRLLHDSPRGLASQRRNSRLEHAHLNPTRDVRLMLASCLGRDPIDWCSRQCVWRQRPDLPSSVAPRVCCAEKIAPLGGQTLASLRSPPGNLSRREAGLSLSQFSIPEFWWGYYPPSWKPAADLQRHLRGS